MTLSLGLFALGNKTIYSIPFPSASLFSPTQPTQATQ